MDEKKEMVTLKISVHNAIEIFNALYVLIKKEADGKVDFLLDSEFQAILDFLKELYDALDKKGCIIWGKRGEIK